MAVYVDKARHRYRRMIMCHMMADTLEELHMMADKIGLNRKWFQGKSTPHYDVCLSFRKKAVQLGAIEVGMKEAGIIIRRLRQAKSALVGTAPVVCRGCGKEINPDYGRCRRCG